VNWSAALVAELNCPNLTVTSTVPVPTAAGAVAVIEVELVTVELATLLPK
jgi:hypothetical protein